MHVNARGYSIFIFLSLVLYIAINLFNYDSNINPWSTELCNLNFQSLEVVSRYHDTQLQVTENLLFVN